MKFRAEQLGYCPNCLTNVEHVRAVKSALLKVVDIASFHIPQLFGLGPWYCMSCGKRRLLFPPYRRNAGSYDPNPKFAAPLAKSDIESVGNMHYSAVSLVHRSNRAKYYSEKFRDGIAERILSCSATFSQVQQSLGITELDLQDWISRYHQKRLRSPAIRINSDEELATSRATSDAATPGPSSAPADSEVRSGANAE